VARARAAGWPVRGAGAGGLPGPRQTAAGPAVCVADRRGAGGLRRQRWKRDGALSFLPLPSPPLPLPSETPWWRPPLLSLLPR
jgi:hypothetical protein